MESSRRTVKVLLTVQAVLIGMIVGLAAGILAAIAGAMIVQMIAAGAVGFASAVPLILTIQRAITS